MTTPCKRSNQVAIEIPWLRNLSWEEGWHCACRFALRLINSHWDHRSQVSSLVGIEGRTPPCNVQDLARGMCELVSDFEVSQGRERLLADTAPDLSSLYLVVKGETWQSNFSDTRESIQACSIVRIGLQCKC